MYHDYEHGFNNEQLSNEFVNILAADIDSQKRDSGSETIIRSEKSKCVDCSHLYLDRFIDINVYETTPYNQFVSRHHPRCKAGSVAAACALSLSYALDNLTFKGFYYDFPSIKNLIKQGNYYPGGPSTLGVQSLPLISELIRSYDKSYGGAVKSMAQLMWDFGKEINTDYQLAMSTANLFDAYNLMKTFGVEISQFCHTFDFGEFMKLLCDENRNIIIADFEDPYTGERFCGIVEGGEVLGYSGNPEVETSAMIFIYRVDSNFDGNRDDDYYHISKYDVNGNEIRIRKFFSVKLK